MSESTKTTFYPTRRDFLKYLSISGLAFSPLVTASRALAATGAQSRLLLVPISHGMGGRNMATGTETNFTPAQWLAPFAEIQKHVIFIDGLLGTFWGNAHDVSYSHVFTGSVQPGTASFTLPRSASLDVLLEAKLGRKVLPVQRLGVNEWGGGGSLAKSYSYDTRFQPLPFQFDPTQAFQAIVNNISGVGAPQEKLSALAQKRRKLLDEATADIRALRQRIGPKERQKLDFHLEAIQNASANLGLNQKVTVGGHCQKPSALTGTSNYELWLRQQLLNLKTAFSCNLAQIAVLDLSQLNHDLYEWKDESGKTRRGQPCADKDFHQCVAHYSNSEQRLCYEGSVLWFARKMVDFAKELDAITEDNGKTMLENTIIVITGEVGDGQHETLSKPHIIIGGSGAPKLRTGRYLKIPLYEDDYLRTPEGNHTLYGKQKISTRTEADLWKEIAGAMGMPVQTFGQPYLNKGSIGIV
ncbi:MAG: DUF1552 domain-containing protein [Myxococcales bacterium]|nr:DUF1552 domain-containing protein [Myxococcales bacterium]